MKLETKYGVIEGTVEEFKELLEGKKDLSYFSGEADLSWMEEESGYYVVNTDKYKAPTKGTVLKHKAVDIYVDTVGDEYLLHKDDLDACTNIGIGDLFKGSKERGSLLKQEVDKSEYYIVSKDDVRCYVYPERNIPKGLVLKHKVLKGYNNVYTDTMGTEYMLSPEDLEDFSMPWVAEKFKYHKDKGILLIQKVI